MCPELSNRILALIAAFDIAALLQHTWNCNHCKKSLFSATGSQTLAFEYRRYGRLTLETAGLLVLLLLNYP